MANETNEVVTVEKKKGLSSDALEVIIIVLLGLTALLTAWASWISGLHGGNQATNYTSSNNTASDGNSRYNEAAQNLMQDMMLWSEIGDLQYDILFEMDETEHSEGYTLNCYKLYSKVNEQMSAEMAAMVDWDFDAYADMDAVEAIEDWLSKDAAVVSPFDDDDYVDSYYADAMEVLKEAEDLKVQGQKDNANGDKYALVTLLYSIVLFLLGIAGTFKNDKNKLIIIVISTVCMVLATVYMIAIPLPTGFSISSFFQR